MESTELLLLTARLTRATAMQSTTVRRISITVLPIGRSIVISFLYIRNPMNHTTRLSTLTALSEWSSFRMKKSAIMIAIIGANTEPIR